MQALLHAISGVLTLIFMGLIGCYLAKIGWINKDNKALLPKLVTNVSLPLFFIYFFKIFFPLKISAEKKVKDNAYNRYKNNDHDPCQSFWRISVFYEYSNNNNDVGYCKWYPVPFFNKKPGCMQMFGKHKNRSC